MFAILYILVSITCAMVSGLPLTISMSDYRIATGEAIARVTVHFKKRSVDGVVYMEGVRQTVTTASVCEACDILILAWWHGCWLGSVRWV